MPLAPRRPRLGGLSINRLLPNALTTLALCAGMTAIRYAIQARWEAAVLAIVIAAVLDALDGSTARLLHGETKFGQELDSLSDVVCFGVAPAITLCLWALHDAGTFGWLAALSLSVGAALRLARFNSKLDDVELHPRAKDYFAGVPSPGGAGLALLPMVLQFALDAPVDRLPFLVAVWTAVAGLLMVSSIPTFSVKRIRVPHRLMVPVLAAVGLVAAALVSAPWMLLSVVGICYIGSLPFSLRQYRKLTGIDVRPEHWMGSGREAQVSRRRAERSGQVPPVVEDEEPQSVPPPGETH